MKKKLYLLPLATTSAFLHTSCTPPKETKTAVASWGDFAAKKLPDSDSLDKKFFASMAPEISQSTFDARWKNSLDTPLSLLRSHVRAYYAITQKIVPTGSPIGYCFGDAHLANFGFIEAKNGSANFLYNDLDDSGICPVALDALRYFTSLRLSGTDDDVKKYISLYSKMLSGSEQFRAIPKSFIPNFQAVREETLKKETKQNKFDRGAGDFHDVDPNIATTVAQAVAVVLTQESQGQPQIQDVVLSREQGGGSFGLTRYWALVQTNQADIIEIKQTAEPATSYGKWGIVPGERLETLKQIFWGGDDAARVYRDANFNGLSWVVRSRVKVSMDPTKLKSDDRDNVYQSEVSLLAKLHKPMYPSFSHDNAKDIEAWLDDGSKQIAKLYQDVFKKQK